MTARIYLVLRTIYLDSACGPFTKHRERIKKFRETGNLKYHKETNSTKYDEH